MAKTLGEFALQKAMVFLLPYRDDIWRDNAKPAQKMIVDLCNIVVKHEPVILGVIPKLKQYLKDNFELDKNVRIIEMKYNDAWPRDSISNVVFDDKGNPFIYAYHFNAYGTPLYEPWDDDETLDEQVSKIFGYKVKQSPLTTEGGNMISDGNGTMFAVKEAFVNDNRNPGMSVEEVEKLFKESTGCSQIVWIKRGLEFDETGGHVDNILAFADGKTMLLSWTDDKDNEHYQRVREIEKQLVDVRNVNGEKYHIVHVPIPRITHRSEEDCKNIKAVDSSFARLVGDPVLNTYVNIALGNGIVIVPKYGLESDQEAYEIMKKVFPDREIVQYDGKEASLGGGGFHCLSKHIN